MRKSLYSSQESAFCALLIETRDKAGLTQADVAKRLKRPQSFVSKYEAGERRIDMIEFVTITRALGADPVQLLRAFLKRTAF